MEEARSAAQLRHRAIVPVFDADEYEGIPFIVSDFIRGVTLAESLKIRPADRSGRRPDWRPSWPRLCTMPTSMA